jgi:prepilin-type N-terminal cleavage/methylation domain-containing protein
MNCDNLHSRHEASRRPTGFTLIEVLTVLCVIGILVTLYFSLWQPAMDSKDRKKAETELAVLRTALDKFHHIHKSYPHCPKGICTPSETLFLSLIGFHNGKGSLTIKPKKKALDQESLFELNTDKYDPANVPEEHQSHKKFVAYLKSLLQRDIAFVDPWGTPYVYVQDRNGKGYQLYSKGPDGQTGEGFDADDVLLE